MNCAESKKRGPMVINMAVDWFPLYDVIFRRLWRPYHYNSILHSIIKVTCLFLKII